MTKRFDPDDYARISERSKAMRDEVAQMASDNIHREPPAESPSEHAELTALHYMLEAARDNLNGLHWLALAISQRGTKGRMVKAAREALAESRPILDGHAEMRKQAESWPFAPGEVTSQPGCRHCLGTGVVWNDRIGTACRHCEPVCATVEAVTAGGRDGYGFPLP